MIEILGDVISITNMIGFFKSNFVLLKDEMEAI